ncbi:MAG: hypothetical protein DI629_11255 [Mesorhizobium amorphae]|nr:MAG: hypothetical protein DI629_11255 [Mesorhizobium amorphae]
MTSTATSTVLVTRPNRHAQAQAKTIAFASIARGAVGLLAPQVVQSAFGIPGSPARIRACALADLGAGLSILASPEPARTVWARTAADAVGVATVLPALGRDNPKRAAAGAALLFLAATTAFHAKVALHGDTEDVHEEIR